ncbi:hypothetical protein [Arthrobacter zhaoguopingii]|uniref:hypothetical protein n=1 Tax=Arthrobacter zhaoguopingii TaxID=2681491 RepID=UPI001359BA12|nr:hypothetical protein [Arthrobacter zhaoguopingii]
MLQPPAGPVAALGGTGAPPAAAGRGGYAADAVGRVDTLDDLLEFGIQEIIIEVHQFEELGHRE